MSVVLVFADSTEISPMELIMWRNSACCCCTQRIKNIKVCETGKTGKVISCKAAKAEVKSKASFGQKKNKTQGVLLMKSSKVELCRVQRTPLRGLF